VNLAARLQVAGPRVYAMCKRHGNRIASAVSAVICPTVLPKKEPPTMYHILVHAALFRLSLSRSGSTAKNVSPRYADACTIVDAFDAFAHSRTDRR
jgi:hypothetical protein